MLEPKGGTVTSPAFLTYTLIRFLFLGGEVVLADAAELAGEIVGQVFPLHAGLVLVIDPAADIAYVFHLNISFPSFSREAPINRRAQTGKRIYAGD